MLFWIVIIAVAFFCAAILALAVLRGRAGAEPPAAYDLKVYRDQLREVERDRARGVIGAEEAERLRAEVSRRILAADAQLRAHGRHGGQPRLAGWSLAGVAVLVVGGGSALLYAQMGAPGYGDVPLAGRIAASEAARADRMSQDAAEAEAGPRLPAGRAQPSPSEDYKALMAQLREKIKERPDDVRGLMLLARNEAALGNLTAAHEAQDQLIAAKGETATAQDYAMLADLMISAAGGYVSREAEAALRTALERNPRNPWARYYLGHYLIQVDRPDKAFRTWKNLLDESRADAPWVEPIRARIEEIAWRAGVQYELPPEGAEPAPGPSAADREAAGDMTAEDRAGMIRGMVSQLAERLASDGGTAREWARLINAYGVLGETEEARAAWERAQEVFAGSRQELDILRAAARDAGLAE